MMSLTGKEGGQKRTEKPHQNTQNNERNQTKQKKREKITARGIPAWSPTAVLTTPIAV